MEIKQMLKDWRQGKHLSLRAAGNLLGVSGQGYCNWERGARVPSARYWEAIARALGLTFDEVMELCLGGDDNKAAK